MRQLLFQFLMVMLVAVTGGFPLIAKSIQSNNTMIDGPFFDTKKVPESPEPPSPDWSGILIQALAAHQLTMKQRKALIHGYYRLGGSEYPLDDDDLRIHAVNMATKLTYEAGAGQRDDSPIEPEEPRPPLSRDDIRDMVFTGYFNTDLMLTLKLPPTGGKYRVWVTMGPVKSNELLLEISVR